MGMIYWVICKDCKVKRDLDKFSVLKTVKNKAEALQVAKEIGTVHGLRASLLVTFMYEHQGHHCTLLDDCHDMEEFLDYKEENFWCKYV